MSESTQVPQGGAGDAAGRTRPGAMTMAMQAVSPPTAGPKVLRIGVVKNGKIVEERIVRTRETVTVGASEKNHFILRMQGLPSGFPLFQLVGDDYILNFTPAMKGRVGLPGGVQELDQLRTTGAARDAGSHFQVKLTDASKGKIVLGDVTLLFQFVEAPPKMPRPQLPASARGGFVKGIDWAFTAFVVFSYMLFFGFIVYLENADWAVDSGISAVPDRMARLIFEEPPAPEVPVDEPELDAEAEAEAKADAANEAPQRRAEAPSKGGGGERGPGDPGVNAEARARIAQEAAARAEAMILGALGSGGALSDVLAGGAVTGNAEDVLAQASGVGVASGSSGPQLRTRTGGGGSGTTGDLGALTRAGTETATQARGTEVVERRISGKIDLGNGGDIGGAGEFDASVVVRTIRARLRAIQACYETELRKNPSLAGKVTVEFTIQERGNVTNARAAENTTGSGAVADCVVNTVARFRFNPGPEGGSVTFSYPFVFAPQN